MMPVIRVSAPTWERLKSHARPLEDTPEDVIRLALDALDSAKGRTPIIPAPRKPSTSPKGKKLPQKEFRAPLLDVLRELGGEAKVSEIKSILEPKVAPRLSDADYALVSTGEPRWWNAVCWERNSLVKEGILSNASPRGVWALSRRR